MTTATEQTQATNYKNASAVHLGALEDWKGFQGTVAESENVYSGKLWLKDLLQLTGLELSLSSIPAGGSVPFEHIHDQNEEIYLFLSGEGQMQVDDQIIEVGAGSVVRVDPAGVRCWRNTGTVDLVHVVIQAKAGSLEQWTAVDGTITSTSPCWS